ncbi:hypothetical protein ACO0OL_002238 [Hanseniaspora opuntiae]
MSIYNDNADHEILKISYGFNDQNSVLYDFIVSYFKRNHDNVDKIVNKKDFNLIFTALIPNRLFSDTVHFINTKYNTSISSQIMNTIIELPVFKKLKKDHQTLNIHEEDECHIRLLRNMYESYYKVDESGQVTHMMLPKATFDRLLQILMNPLDSITSLSEYFKTLSKIFIPLNMVNNAVFIPFNEDIPLKGHDAVHIMSLFDKPSNKSKIDTYADTYTVQPKLESYLKADSEIIRNKEFEKLVHKVRNIMAYNFGFDDTKPITECDLLEEVHEPFVTEDTEDSDYSDFAPSDNTSDSDDTDVLSEEELE